MPLDGMRDRGRSFGRSLGKDSHTTQMVLDNEYQVYTIVTTKALNEFTEEWLVKKRPGIIGIDSEAAADREKIMAERKEFGTRISPPLTITVLQLATSKFLCLIDVHLLSKQKDMDDEKWEQFFQKLFHPEITIVGFSLQNDFRFIYSRFPFIKAMIKNHQKMYCLAKLSDEIRKNEEFFVIAFNGLPPKDNGIAALANLILNVEMDKTHQTDNWMVRPLSIEQICYALKDALIPFLIREEIIYIIESNMNVDDAIKFMKKGYMEMNKMKWF